MSNIIANLAIYNSLIVEAKINRTPQNGDSYTFDFNSTLAKAQIYGIELITAEQLSASPSGNTVIAQNAANGLIFTFTQYKTELQFTQDMPGTRLVPSLYQGITPIWKPRKISLEKSFFQITDNTNLNLNDTVLLQFFFELDRTKEI